MVPARMQPTDHRHLRRPAPEGAAPGSPDEATDLGARTESEAGIVCAACGATITRPAHRITVQDSHEHRFLNPAGLLFHIGCFDQAIGCTIVGPASLEYPWFPGCSWRLARCGQCGVQLGWHFRNETQEAFFGLILDRLRDTALDG